MGIKNFFKCLKLACRAFARAFSVPQKTEKFLENQSVAQPKEQKPAKDISHLRLLAHLQDSARLIDFLQEDISDYSDEQVGAAVRKIHADAAAALEELVTIRPLLNLPEGSNYLVEAGYSSCEIKLSGNIVGKPPYKNGTLIHCGWKAHKISLPKKMISGDEAIIAPAEVEIS